MISDTPRHRVIERREIIPARNSTIPQYLSSLPSVNCLYTVVSPAIAHQYLFSVLENELGLESVLPESKAEQKAVSALII